jgi:hypothetical protein
VFYKTTSALTADLLSLPETGMGYQVIDAKRKDKYTKERFLVYNAELIVELDVKIFEAKQQIVKEGFNRILNKANYLSLENVTIVNKSVIQEVRYLTESKTREKQRHSGGRGAADNQKENADGRETFVRLSAYQNDRRIDFESKRLKPGTYTTTRGDYRVCVMYKDDPVDRYALPNDEKIKYAFEVRPKINDTLQRGIVQPAFGHDGGGIEVYFAEGTSKDTYVLVKPYGE